MRNEIKKFLEQKHVKELWVESPIAKNWLEDENVGTFGYDDVSEKDGNYSDIFLYINDVEVLHISGTDEELSEKVTFEYQGKRSTMNYKINELTTVEVTFIAK